ncbi:hypothetical protein Taro_036261 [Colocasia esculenta]|uniref:Uncharacterized protein n=1 Tax=Colocasia esculenta TaxID=4460 RepID=A0A843WFT5_COLES|nr:hypothetical protein [Colocasia esculenta]
MGWGLHSLAISSSSSGRELCGPPVPGSLVDGRVVHVHACIFRASPAIPRAFVPVFERHAHFIVLDASGSCAALNEDLVTGFPLSEVRFVPSRQCFGRALHSDLVTSVVPGSPRVYLVTREAGVSPLPPAFFRAAEKSTVFTSRDLVFSSLGDLPLPYEAVGFSAKKISISTTVLLRCSNVRILAPRSFSLIPGFRLLWHSFTASSCVGGCSHFMLMSRHLLMKSRADSFLFCFKDMSSAKVTLLSVTLKRSKNFFAYLPNQLLSWASIGHTIEMLTHFRPLLLHIFHLETRLVLPHFKQYAKTVLYRYSSYMLLRYH